MEEKFTEEELLYIWEPFSKKDFKYIKNNNGNTKI